MIKTNIVTLKMHDNKESNDEKLHSWSVTYVHLQCQQCDSKYHTLLWTRFNHFLVSRKITPTQSKRTNMEASLHLVHVNNRIDFIESYSLFDQAKTNTILRSSTSLAIVTHSLRMTFVRSCLLLLA